jgi:hypothetical protein
MLKFSITGYFFSDRFEWSQDTDDLERGVSAAHQALDLSSPGDAFQASVRIASVCFMGTATPSGWI